MSPELHIVKNFLEQQHITTSLEWIEACISFIKEEHAQNVPQHSLKNFVYRQWLSADLEEIGVAVLPLNLPVTQNTTLDGSFAIQVDGIKDIGRSAYSQLKELEQDMNSNAEFSAEPAPNRPSWEEKPTRMLLMTLTDGLRTIQGIEYKPIKNLSPNLNPGVKVLIQGPVNCRFGVLLLSEDNIKVLGGEVESKIERFSRRNLLRQALQLPLVSESQTARENDVDAENHAPPPPAGPAPRVDPGSENVQPRRSEPSAVSRRGAATRGHLFAQVMTRGAPPPPARASDDVDGFEDDDDDFVQSLDYRALDQIERSSAYQSSSAETADNVPDIWLEDEDILQDMMAFQDENPGFEMPVAEQEELTKVQNSEGRDKPFTYLSAVVDNPVNDRVVTIKGFIITVLSKLECTVDKGWNLFVRINDGSATLDANIHDQVLEKIVGVSAVTMVKMQSEAATNPEKRKEVMEAISKCKSTLQDFNCLMDIKFSTGNKPCIVKCHPIEHIHVQQLMERIKSK